ncbi:hypothetical protein C427_3773 [Paraglaciecola psychrophila 170]|uniref:Uncharacterized protein n=1 Tax=Paraglaciecola psychrophila 170 TaxID=1129794 RepID=K7A9T9_9ALTE|nr:hypothetical protein C427_3773 [Paraglaciecola psychrophila 170]GAC37498.1 hypothetical protein GPSY_1874 [Paraglaciecola psychrophila 170]
MTSSTIAQHITATIIIAVNSCFIPFTLSRFVKSLCLCQLQSK